MSVATLHLTDRLDGWLQFIEHRGSGHNSEFYKVQHIALSRGLNALGCGHFFSIKSITSEFHDTGINHSSCSGLNQY